MAEEAKELVQTEDLSLIQRKRFIIALMILFTSVFLWVIQGYIITILMATIFAALLQPAYDALRSKLGAERRGIAAGLLLFLVMIVVGIPVIGLLSLAAAEGLKISQAAVAWINLQVNQNGTVNGLVPDWVPFAAELSAYKATIFSKLAEWAGTASGFIIRILSAATQGTAQMLVDLFILLYAMFFFLIWGHGTMEAIYQYLPLGEKDRQLIRQKGLFMSRAMLKSILIIGSIQGFLLGLAFWVCGIDAPVFWGLIVVLISAIPGIGSGIIWIPAAVYLVASGQYGYAAGLTFWGILIIGMVDNILRPRLVERDTKMPDLLVLVSTLGGLTAFGAAGIILGPVLAAVMITVLEIYKDAFKDILADPDGNT
ncbi:AI-2E family transporter [Emcibacter sp.]|uniref:AI-2E family transporter n=1 Tax=Emcibacter sp. TaxID=1979954 RepID=UPI002AA6F803|nr:AI-2E family transporter [Emcibacter sp.]